MAAILWHAYDDMMMKPYLQVELIEGGEELCDCTNAFVCNVDAVSNLGRTKITKKITVMMKIITKTMLSMLTKIFTLTTKKDDREKTIKDVDDISENDENYSF